MGEEAIWNRDLGVSLVTKMFCKYMIQAGTSCIASTGYYKQECEIDPNL